MNFKIGPEGHVESNPEVDALVLRLSKMGLPFVSQTSKDGRMVWSVLRAEALTPRILSAAVELQREARHDLVDTVVAALRKVAAS